MRRREINQALDASDVQELWVKVFKRQGRLIYPERIGYSASSTAVPFRGL
jgi:hypothetical protein